MPGPRTGHPPYSTVADAESLNTVLRVLSCGPEWGGAESGHGDYTVHFLRDKRRQDPS